MKDALVTLFLFTQSDLKTTFFPVVRSRALLPGLEPLIYQSLDVLCRYFIIASAWALFGCESRFLALPPSPSILRFQPAYRRSGGFAEQALETYRCRTYFSLESQVSAMGFSSRMPWSIVPVQRRSTQCLADYRDLDEQRARV